MPEPIPDSCVRARVGLPSPSRARPIKGAGHVSQSDVGRQPHGPDLPPARHVHVAHGVAVARPRAAGGGARRPQDVGLRRRGARAVGRLRAGRDRRTPRPHPGRSGVRVRHANAAVECGRAAPGSGARRRRGRDHLRHHRHLARALHPQRHRRSRDARRGLPRVQRLHRRLQPRPARTLLRARLPAQPRRRRRGRRGPPLRRAGPARRGVRAVGLQAPGVAPGMGAAVGRRGGHRSRDLVSRLRGRRRDGGLRRAGGPEPGVRRLVDGGRAAPDGRDLRLGDPVGRLRAPSEAHPGPGRERDRLAAVHARASGRHVRGAPRRRSQAQAPAERLLQAADVRDVPEGLPRRARDGGDRARQRHVGLGHPHRDGTWPFSQKAIEEQFRGIAPAIQSKMLWDNVRRVYRIT